MQRGARSPFERRGKVIADLKACISSRDLERGIAIHDAAVQCGDVRNMHVASTLIDMYTKCGSMERAHRAFDCITHPDVVPWTSLILGYAEHGEGEKALGLFTQMRQKGYTLDSRTFVAALKACSELGSKSVERGRALGLLALECGFDSSIFVQGSLVNMYAACGSMDDAHVVFERISDADVVTWTTLIMGYAALGDGETALSLFSRMRREDVEPSARAFVAVIKACLAMNHGRTVCREKAAKLHLLAAQSGFGSDMYFGSALLDMYSKCGAMNEARSLFDRVKAPDVAFWTAVMFGYADNGEAEVALELFTRMRSEGCAPNSRSFAAALKACVELATREDRSFRHWGRVLHLLSLRSGCYPDVYVQGVLLDVYAKCGAMSDARYVFDNIQHVNPVCWNSLLMGYAENGQGEQVLDMLLEMVRDGCCAPSEVTFVACLKACASLAVKNIARGRKLHLLASRSGYASDSFVQGALVDMYIKHDNIEEARRVFESIVNPDVVPWTTMISGYAENGENHTALELFSQMRRQGCAADAGAFVAALKACSNAGKLGTGKALHAEIRGQSFEHDAVLKTTLVDFYAKCGSLALAEDMFNSCDTRNVGTWNALMAGYSHNGNTRAAFALLERMLDRGLKPDGITFKSILAVCRHAGLVEQAMDHFEAMSRSYGVAPDVEHYNCMIDILGRSGKLDEAMALLRSVPLDVTVVVWMSILGACRKRKNVVLGKLAFESVISLDNRYARAYVEMSNIQAPVNED